MSNSTAPRALIYVWNNPPLIESCLKLAQVLVGQGIIPIIVTLRGDDDDRIAAAGFRHESIYNAMAAAGGEALDRIKGQAGGLHNLKVHNIPLWDACAYERQALKRGMAGFEMRTETELIAKTALCIEGWLRLIDKYQPRYCFVWNGLVLPSLGLKRLCAERCLPCASLERGLLPDMLVVDPVGVNYGGLLGGERWSRFDGALPPPDIKAAERYTEAFVRSGRTIVTSGKDVDSIELRQRFNIPSGKRIILLPLQLDFDTNILYYSPFYPTNLSVVRELVDAVRMLKDWFIIVKAHPENPAEDLASFSEVMGGDGAVVSDISLASLLNAADIVTVRNSTVGLEAALHDKPVIALAQSAWSGKGFSFDATGRGQIAGLLQRVDEFKCHPERHQNLMKFTARLIKDYHFRLEAGADSEEQNRRVVGRTLNFNHLDYAAHHPKLCDWSENLEELCGEAPFISVIIATHNRAGLVGRAVESALDQDYMPFEVIVVDDGSTDNTAEVIKSYNDARLRYLRKEPSGAPDTINLAIQSAKGDYVIQLDDDDQLLSGALRRYGSLARLRPDRDVIFGELEYIEDGRISRDEKYPRYDGKVPLQNVVMGCPLPHGGTLIRRRAFDTIGLFNPAFRRAYDYEWWSRALPRLTVLHCGEFVYRWFIHSQSLTAFTAKDFSQVDTSYEADIIRGMLSRHSLQELFPTFDWDANRRRATAQAMLMIGAAFLKWRANDEAKGWLERSRRLFPLAQTYQLLSKLARLSDDIISAVMLARCALTFAPFEPQINAEYSDLISQLSLIEPIAPYPQHPIGRHYVNITIVTFNRLEFTKRCIASILRHTLFPYVITVIDNGSTDGTPDYLRELKQLGKIKNLILYPENMGVAVAANDGWDIEDADYYLKLDNDIVITKPGWLAALVETVDRSPRVGVAGYNFEAASFPLVELDGIPVRLKPSGGNIGGCCILIPRRTHERLGYWAEVFGPYSEEDGDYGARVHLAGMFNVYLADEHIGLHLPDGRAAVIDENLNIHSSEDPSYREFKENCRRSAINLRNNRVEAIKRGELPLYQPRGAERRALLRSSPAVNVSG